MYVELIITAFLCLVPLLALVLPFITVFVIIIIIVSTTKKNNKAIIDSQRIAKIEFLKLLNDFVNNTRKENLLKIRDMQIIPKGVYEDVQNLMIKALDGDLDALSSLINQAQNSPYGGGRKSEKLDFLAKFFFAENATRTQRQMIWTLRDVHVHSYSKYDEIWEQEFHYDLSFLQYLIHSGFLDQIYKIVGNRFTVQIDDPVGNIIVSYQKSKIHKT